MRIYSMNQNASYSEHIGKNPNEVTHEAKGCDGGDNKNRFKRSK